MDLSKAMRIGDLCKRMGGRSRSSIYNDIEGGRLPPPLKLGKSAYWDEAEVDAYLERQFSEQRAAREAAK